MNRDFRRVEAKKSCKNIRLTLLFLLPFFCMTIATAQKQSVELKFDHLTVNNGLPQNSVYSIVKDKYGFMWFGTWGGACRYDGYTTKLFRANETDSSALFDNIVKVILKDSLQNIWVKTSQTTDLHKYNYETEKFSRFPLTKVPKYVLKLLARWKIEQYQVVQNKRYRWNTQARGLAQTDLQTGVKQLYLADFSNSFTLTDNTINFLYLDDHQNLWVGTQNGGVNHANINTKPFAYLPGSDNKGLIDNVVRAICKDSKGRLWIGTENSGIYIRGNSLSGTNYSKLDSKCLSNLRIRSIYCDREGNLWIGTKAGIDKYDFKTSRTKHYQTDRKGGLMDPNVFSIMEDHKGELWIGTFKGIAKYNRTKDCFEHLKPSLTGGLKVRAMMEDSRRNLWVATEDGGLTRFSKSTHPSQSFDFGSPIRFLHREGDQNTILNNRVASLAEDKYGKIWIGTNSGVSVFDPQKKQFRNLTIQSGLADDLIMSVLADDKESVWISHKKGLSRIHISTFDCQNFNMSDGLQGLEFNQNAAFRDSKTGELYFGGINGLNSFYPAEIKRDLNKSSVILTRLRVLNQDVEPGTKINDRMILEKSINCASKIELTWWEKTFSLEFSAMQYANPSGNKYKYRLEGVDKQWIFTDASHRVASYSDLSSGKYEFQVLAANNDGVWSDSPTCLTVEVLPPWWATWWAILIYVAIACAIIWGIFNFISARIALRRKEEIHQSKLRFFTEVSHEFRTPLTLIIDPAEKLMNENPGDKAARYYHSLIYQNAKQLLLLVNQLLDFRKLEAGYLTLNYTESDIVQLVKSIVETFENQASQQNVALRFQSDADSLCIGIDTAKITMVMNNLITNAFKFTPAHGEIEVEIVTAKSSVEIRVKDTGTGIAKEEQSKIFDMFYQSSQAAGTPNGSGIGLSLTKELVHLHRGEILLESEAGKGSCFTIRIPYSLTKTASNNVECAVNPPEQSETNPNAMDLTGLSATDERPHLLIVDDHSDIRNYIATELADICLVSVTKDGAEGYQTAIDTIPDVIISDVMMPVMDGIELCRQLKTDERTSHIPVILLTARKSDEAMAEGFETGADAYVIKPFNTMVLRAQIQSLLDQRQRLRQLFSKGTYMEIKKISINTTDEIFLNKVTQIIKDHLHEEDFEIELLTSKLKMSRSQLYRKVKALTNQSLYGFVNTHRMNRALEYLVSGEFTISEIAYKVGFTLPTNFTRAFTKFYGEAPSKYLNSLDENKI